MSTTIFTNRSAAAALTAIRQTFAIRREERWPATLVLMAVVALQALMTGKFCALLAHPTHEAWLRFMRNYHMSGYDPITYSVVMDWHMGYDVLRHPLLAFMMWPLAAVDRLAVWLTGCDITVWIVAMLLTFCAFYAFMFLYRTLHDGIGVSSRVAWLLTFMFMGFGHVAVATVVADHFCLSMFMLLLTIYRAAVKIREGRRFGVGETITLFVATAGITLSNGIPVLMAVTVTNGIAALKPRFLYGAMMLPAVAMLVVGLALAAHGGESNDMVSQPVAQQMKWTRSEVDKGDVFIENVFGESLQLHRRHVLGDVLSGRPVIVRYTCGWQYAVEAFLLLTFLIGMAMGLRDKIGIIAATIFLYNMALHLALGFAVDEIHIMAAHWTFTVPLAMAWVFKRPAVGRGWRGVRIVAITAVTMVTIYLWAYHGWLLFRYLTWPLCK